MAGRLDGKIAIVTGTATGIGSAIARLFVDEGAKVYATDVKDPGDQLAACLSAHPDAIRFARLDVRSEEQWAAALAACTSAFGAPNVLINNAGIGSTHKPVHEETLDNMRANFEVNVIGMFLGMKTVLPGMMAAGGGAIVNVASVWGWTGIKNNAAYQTAKAAAVMLSKNAAVTYAPHNIRINCVLPGYVDTPMSRTVTEEDAQMLMEFTPLGRRAEPEEMAPMFVFLASDESSFVAAANFMNDGGMSAAMSEAAEVRHFPLGDFALESGATLPAAQIAYTTYGTLNAARDNAIVFPTWFVGSHLDVEWMIGEGAPLDTAKYFVVVAHMFGNGHSSSPSNTPAPFDRARFPKINVRDNVRAQHRLVTEGLGITKVQLVIGGSMGAFQAYQWGLSHPGLVARIAPMCGAAQVSRHCYVFLEGPKSALLADPAYRGGDYDAVPEVGLKALARIWAGWALSQQFWREELYRRMGFDSVEAFLTGFWEAFWVKCDANDLLCQLHVWQTADLAQTPGYDGDLARALGDIRATCIQSPGEKDLYFPPEDMAWEAAQMPNAECRPIPGPWGHFSEVGIDPACNEFLGNSIRMLLAR